MSEADLIRQIERLEDSHDIQRISCGDTFSRINNRFEDGTKVMATQSESIKNLWLGQAAQTGALTEIKMTMKEFRAEVKEQIADLRSEVNQSIAAVKVDVCGVKTTVDTIKAEGSGKNKLAEGFRGYVPLVYSLITTALAVYYFIQSLKGGN